MKNILRTVAAAVLLALTPLVAQVPTNIAIARFGNGTVAIPSASFQNDTNTGLYWISADLFGATIGGTLRTSFGATGINFPTTGTGLTLHGGGTITGASGAVTVTAAVNTAFTVAVSGTGTTVLGGNVLLGGSTNGTGQLQLLGTGGTSASGIGFATDSWFFRTSAADMTLTGTGLKSLFFFRNAGASGIFESAAAGGAGIAFVGSGTMNLQTSGATALTLDASQNATFAGYIKANNLYPTASNQGMIIGPSNALHAWNIGTGAKVNFIPITDSTTSGTQIGVSITPTYNQTSGTSANTDLLINRTQTAVGSGAQRLIDVQVAGVTKFNVTNNGVVSLGDFTTLRTEGNDGVLILGNAAHDSFTTLVLGPYDTASPAIRRNGSAINFKVSYTATDAAITAGNVTINATSPITGVRTATATLDFGTILAAQSAELTITVTGALVNDVVDLGPPATQVDGAILSARVTATNTVTVRCNNAGSISIDPASATYRVSAMSF